MFRKANDKLYTDTCGKCGARRVDAQLGLESTPEEHVAAMVAVFDEVRRVLRPDGVLFLNYGDCYAGGGHGGHIDNKAAAGVQGPRYNAPPGLKPKDLVGMPWRIAFALQAAGWWLRSDIIWHKPNPMPESVTDRPTKAHEYVFLLTKSARYYYDADAVREGIADSTASDPRGNGNGHRRDRGYTGSPDNGGTRLGAGTTRNLRTVWTINPEPFPESHFATFPQKLAATCILAGTSEYGACAACGTPWERVTESHRVMRHELPRDHKDYRPGRYTRKAGGADDYANGGAQAFKVSQTTGWQPACACGTDETRPCVVLDPFCGSGTTGLVAARYGRSFVGIELNPEYADMARRRIAPALAQPALLGAG